jgi:hypothetical protein
MSYLDPPPQKKKKKEEEEEEKGTERERGSLCTSNNKIHSALSKNHLNPKI